MRFACPARSSFTPKLAALRQVQQPSRNLSDQAPKDEDTSTSNNKTPTMQHRPSPQSIHQQMRDGRMIHISETRKKFLVLSGRWKSTKDIPDHLSENQYTSDMWVVRVRVAAATMVFWLLICLVVANIGRKHLKERSHQVVMQQYLDGLSSEERKKFEEEYDLKSR